MIKHTINYNKTRISGMIHYVLILVTLLGSMSVVAFENMLKDGERRSIFENFNHLKLLNGEVPGAMGHAKAYLIVNVASQCGYTEQNYRELNELNAKYGEAGLRIMAFPCNAFGNQEPGSAKQIDTFIKSRGVTFDVFSKVECIGENIDPLFENLQSSVRGYEPLSWNFVKFLADADGKPVVGVKHYTSPMELVPHIESLLGAQGDL